MRGTFVFPAADRDLMQLLELRGNNGGVETVETMYVLTGNTYSVPERLFACDDPDLYHKAEKRLFNGKLRRVVKMIVDFYADRSGPKLVAFFHTHPSGNATPSTGDKEVVARWKQRFDPYFDEYEFFAGLHGLGEACPPDLERMRVPEQPRENAVRWRGENRHHTLAVYDGAFEPRPVLVETAASLRTGGGHV